MWLISKAYKWVNRIHTLNLPILKDETALLPRACSLIAYVGPALMNGDLPALAQLIWPRHIFNFPCISL